MADLYPPQTIPTAENPIFELVSAGSLTIAGAPPVSQLVTESDVPCKGVYISVYACSNAAYLVITIGQAAGLTAPKGIVVKQSGVPNTAMVQPIFVPVANANMVGVWSSVAGDIFHYTVVK